MSRFSERSFPPDFLRLVLVFVNLKLRLRYFTMPKRRSTLNWAIVSTCNLDLLLSARIEEEDRRVDRIKTTRSWSSAVKYSLNSITVGLFTLTNYRHIWTLSWPRWVSLNWLHTLYLLCTTFPVKNTLFFPASNLHTYLKITCTSQSLHLSLTQPFSHSPSFTYLLWYMVLRVFIFIKLWTMNACTLTV